MTSSLSDFDIPLTEVESTLLEWVEEALDIRFGEYKDPEGKIELPPPESGIQDVLLVLLRVRKRLDRLEGLQARATRAKGRTYRASMLAKDQAQDSWDQKIVDLKSSGVRRGNEYEGPRERYAEASLYTISDQRNARKLERLAQVANEACDVIKSCQRGMDGIRQDLLTIQRSYQFQSSLEH